MINEEDEQSLSFSGYSSSSNETMVPDNELEHMYLELESLKKKLENYEHSMIKKIAHVKWEIWRVERGIE